MHLYSQPYVLHAPLISFSIWSPEHYLVKSRDHQAPHCVVLSTPCFLVPLRPKYYPQHPILKHPQLTFLPQCERPSFAPYKTTGKIIVVHIFIFLDSKLEDKRSCTEW
jgi:hypothetical protein